MNRLPSFNDFSVGIIGDDVRKPLRSVLANRGNWDDLVSEWDRDYFESANNKRASVNVPATLTNLGLLTRDPLDLTESGKVIAEAATKDKAAQEFVKHIVTHHNGMALIDAVASLNSKREPVTKKSLKSELESLGIEGLANATTDHLTLKNWMVCAGVLSQDGSRGAVRPDGAAMKSVLGISSSERNSFIELPIEQQVFLQVLRRHSESDGGVERPTKTVIDECLRDYPGRFKEDQIRSTVLKPLAEGGWLELAAATGRGRGGKSGALKPSKKLMSVPIESIVPDFDSVVPGELRSKINLPLSTVSELLNGTKEYDRGLGLELLALKMIIDLGLEPRAFRLRSRETAHAEVDLTAEGKNLLFSRWNFQCKNTTRNVALGDVAKEVGLAIYSKAHVVAVVTTSGFSRDALAYADEITRNTHLQFLLISGDTVKQYLEKGRQVLLDFVASNAAEVMAEKRRQPISPDPEGG